MAARGCYRPREFKRGACFRPLGSVCRDCLVKEQLAEIGTGLQSVLPGERVESVVHRECWTGYRYDYSIRQWFFFLLDDSFSVLVTPRE